MNYATLTQQVKDFLETDETTFNANIDQFIKLAEERIYRAVRIPELRKNQTGSATSSNEYLTLPADFLSPYELAVDVAGSTGFQYLLQKDVSFIREAFPLSTTTGVPKFYALYDKNTALLGPTPNSNYTMQLHYYYRPAAMSGSNTTTWLGDNFENVLLWGTIVQAYTFLKGEPDLLAVYEKHYQEALDGLKKVEVDTKRDSYRNGERVG